MFRFETVANIFFSLLYVFQTTDAIYRSSWLFGFVAFYARGKAAGGVNLTADIDLALRKLTHCAGIPLFLAGASTE